MINFFKKHKSPELKELKDETEKGDLWAMMIAAFITLVLPLVLLVLVIYGLIYLLLT